MSRIIIKNLPTLGVDESEIRKHFADIDNITDIQLKYNEFGAFRRFAFVGFKTDGAAEQAIEKLNNSFIKNSKIVLEKCKSLKEMRPDKVGLPAKRKQTDDDFQKDQENDDNLGKANSNKITGKGKNAPDVFDEVIDDPEFKEFLDLQRNLGEKGAAKQIWSDDIKINATNPAPTKTSESKKDTGTAEQDSKQNPDGDTSPKKKRKRSRGKKKATKTKPKELFVHTVKINGFAEAKRKDIKEFFKPLELLSVRLNKKDDVCYVSFKDECDLKYAMKKNMQFWSTHRIHIFKHNVKRSRVFKENVKEKVREKEIKLQKYEASIAETEPVEESGRLFVRNLNYTCTQEDLEQVFSKYGELTEVHFPIDKTTSLPKGFATIEFMFPQNAARAFEELSGTIFQGRTLHLIPAKPKPEPDTQNRGFGQNPMQTSSFKREQFSEQRQSTVPKASNWNILFLGQNALADVVSDMKSVDKSKLLTHQTHKDPIAVRLALGDATVVEEMRKFLVSNGIELDSFDNPQAPRSRTVMIAKNLPASTSKEELMGLFEPHGRVARIIVPPNGLSAIIEMEEAVEAKLAFRKLAYSKFKDTLLYLEWAPINVFREKCLDEQERSDLKQLEELQTGTKILIKNIPFEATLHEVKKIFAAYGELNFVRIPKKLDGQHRGFGFVDYLTKEDALRAFRSLCHSTHLYGRKLVLEWAKVEESKSNTVQ